MNRLVLGTAVAAITAIFAASNPAGAVSVTLSYQGSGPFNGGTGGHQDVHIKDGSTGSLYVYAGGFWLNDGATNLIAFCLDLADELTNGVNYDVYDASGNPYTDHSLGATVISNIEHLYEVNYPSVNPTNDAQMAGFQLALWELVYETVVGFDVDGSSSTTGPGSWWAWGGSAAAAMQGIDQATTYLSNAFDAFGNQIGTIQQNYNLIFYDANVSNDVPGASQDLVSVTPVPLPSAIWLLGLGLAGLWGTGRRKKPDTAAA